MKTLLAILALALLAGCATLTNIVSAGAQANDAAAQAAEVTICRGISIGAWVRAYGSDPEKAKAWRELCQDQIEVLP
jgi:uncharacterized lipoprotein YajG